MEELVQKAKNDDNNAFSELIISIEKELYLIAKSKLKDEDDIGDAIQETIFMCYKNLKKLKDNRVFKSWVIKILLNECKKIYKKKYKNIISYEEKELDNYISSNDDNDELEFEILIKDLKSDEQLILTLYYCSKYTTKEISKILNKRESTIKSKLIRSRNKIKKKFEKEGKKYEKC